MTSSPGRLPREDSRPVDCPAMERLSEFTAGAPGSAILLAAIVVASLVGLFVMPAVIERNTYWLVRNREYWTLVGSGFVHADLMQNASVCNGLACAIGGRLRRYAYSASASSRTTRV